MRETLIAGTILLLLLGLAFAVQTADVMKLLYAGLALVGGGLAFSTPFAIVYHWKLYRALAPRGQLDRTWLLNPVRHHDRLREADRPGIMRWFFLGATGWVVCVIGCILLGIAAYLSRGT